jgi:hypothetical protein
MTALKVVEQLVIWRKHKQLLYPIDVINMMIQNGLVTESEVREIIEANDKKSLDIKLPPVYISE